MAWFWHINSAPSLRTRGGVLILKLNRSLKKEHVMRETKIVIPYWKDPAGIETDVRWIIFQNGSCKKRRNLLDFFTHRGQPQRYQGELSPFLLTSELLSSSRAVGLFASYERNYSYLEAKGDPNTRIPTQNELFRLAGFVMGMPVSQEKLEKITGLKNFDSLFDRCRSEVFLYETWIPPRYELQLRPILEDFIFKVTKKMYLNCVTIKRHEVVTKKTALSVNLCFTAEI